MDADFVVYKISDGRYLMANRITGEGDIFRNLASINKYLNAGEAEILASRRDSGSLETPEPLNARHILEGLVVFDEEFPTKVDSVVRRLSLELGLNDNVMDRSLKSLDDIDQRYVDLVMKKRLMKFYLGL